MENELQAFSAKLVKEYEVPMVSMDGEAHPEITLAAVGLGVFVACIILITLVAFISRRKRQLFDNMESGSREMNSSKLNVATDVLTISKQVEDAKSYRSSTITVCSDVEAQI